MNENKITLVDEITLIQLEVSPADIAILSDILQKIANENIDVDMISLVPPYHNTSNLSFTVSDSDFAQVLEVSAQLRKENEKVNIKVNSGNSKIVIANENMTNNPGFAGKVFALLSKHNISLQMVTTAETEISLLVPNVHSQETINILNNL